jgi:SAM-dependent methyltransferase
LAFPVRCVMKPKPFDHNARYHDVLLVGAPPRVDRALDVGCGNGYLLAKLAQIADLAVGIDVDTASLERARRNASAPNVELVQEDVLTAPLPARSFDLVTSVAMLHHADARAALTRMKELVRPGGRLAFLGLARSTVSDLPWDVVGSVRARLGRREASPEPPAPLVWPPPETYASMRALVRELLPGARYRRHTGFRYSVVWTA